MDAAAAFCMETDDVKVLRARLDPIVGQQVKSTENRRMAIDILVNIWARSAEDYPALQSAALAYFRKDAEVTDRLWLHYGMTLLTYDFFRLGVASIGQISRYQDTITPKDVKKRLTAEMGQLGALEKATERIIFSLRNWGIMVDAETRYTYRPLRQHFAASSLGVEEWMLAAALTAHPAEEYPFADLVRLPELFPFRFTLSVDHLRQSQQFAVHRQGMGWDMVRLV